MTSETETRAKEEHAKAQALIMRAVIIMTTASAIFSYAAYYWFPCTLPAMPHVSDRIAFTLQCNIFSVGFLFALFGHIGNVRFATAQADPLSNVDKDRVEVYCRVLQNTVEQFLMSLVLQLITATWITESQMKIIPIVAILFFIGRLLFLKGYLDPAYGHAKRSYGLPLSAQVNLVLLVYCLYRTVASVF